MDEMVTMKGLPPRPPSTSSATTAATTTATELRNAEINTLKSQLLPFPVKLYNMLENESPDVTGWVSNGKAFQVRDVVKFTEEIIPKYFKEIKFKSFQRQLNVYGFKKIVMGTDHGAYFHPSFQLNARHLLCNIVREARKDSKPNSPRKRISGHFQALSLDSGVGGGGGGLAEGSLPGFGSWDDVLDGFSDYSDDAVSVSSDANSFHSALSSTSNQQQQSLDSPIFGTHSHFRNATIPYELSSTTTATATRSTGLRYGKVPPSPSKRSKLLDSNLMSNLSLPPSLEQQQQQPSQQQQPPLESNNYMPPHPTPNLSPNLSPIMNMSTRKQYGILVDAATTAAALAAGFSPLNSPTSSTRLNHRTFEPSFLQQQQQQQQALMQQAPVLPLPSLKPSPLLPQPQQQVGGFGLQPSHLAPVESARSFVSTLSNNSQQQQQQQQQQLQAFSSSPRTTTSPTTTATATQPLVVGTAEITMSLTLQVPVVDAALFQQFGEIYFLTPQGVYLPLSSCMQQQQQPVQQQPVQQQQFVGQGQGYFNNNNNQFNNNNNNNNGYPMMLDTSLPLMKQQHHQQQQQQYEEMLATPFETQPSSGATSGRLDDDNNNNNSNNFGSNRNSNNFDDNVSGVTTSNHSSVHNSHSNKRISFNNNNNNGFNNNGFNSFNESGDGLDSQQQQQQQQQLQQVLATLHDDSTSTTATAAMTT